MPVAVREWTFRQAHYYLRLHHLRGWVLPACVTLAAFGWKQEALLAWTALRRVPPSTRLWSASDAALMRRDKWNKDKSKQVIDREHVR